MVGPFLLSMTPGNAFKCASKNHDFQALTNVMLSTQSSLVGVLLVFWCYLYVCWQQVCLACYQGKARKSNCSASSGFPLHKYVFEATSWAGCDQGGSFFVHSWVCFVVVCTNIFICTFANALGGIKKCLVM